jgi:hypothetical protein
VLPVPEIKGTFYTRPLSLLLYTRRQKEGEEDEEERKNAHCRPTMQGPPMHACQGKKDEKENKRENARALTTLFQNCPNKLSRRREMGDA